MGRVLIAINRLARGHEGQDLLEYGLLAALIAIGAIVSIRTLGNTINTVFWETIAQTL